MGADITIMEMLRCSETTVDGSGGLEVAVTAGLPGVSRISLENRWFVFHLGMLTND